MESPILLTAEFSLLPGADTKGLADSSLLQNPFGTAMLLDEIRFTVNNFQHSRGGEGGIIRAAFKLGRTPITNGFIPIWNFGKVLNPIEALGAVTVSTFTWKLPKPLYIPPSEYLIPTLQNIAMPSGLDLTAKVRVTYAGRSLASNHPTPKAIHVPWVTAYLTPFRGAGTFTDQSTEADLVNPFNESLNVQRFIGRILVDKITATEEVGESVTYYAGLGSRLTTVRMTNSNGVILVRDNTPFNHLFNATDRSWTVNAILPPKGFYLAFFSQNHTGMDAAGYVSSMISMIGHREVKLR